MAPIGSQLTLKPTKKNWVFYRIEISDFMSSRVFSNVIYLVASAQYSVRVKLCSDSNSRTGVKPESIGKVGSLFLINDATSTAPSTWLTRNKARILKFCVIIYNKNIILDLKF